MTNNALFLFFIFKRFLNNLFLFKYEIIIFVFKVKQNNNSQMNMKKKKMSNLIFYQQSIYIKFILFL